METAKETGLKPIAYLTYLFERMLNVDFKNKAVNNCQCDELLTAYFATPDNPQRNVV
ncbi:MAG: transposase domain-containing protein [Clostridiaceae bacterium]|nr:transposase domain-containing protein [Clostridiaceae bacterium]